MNGRTVVSAIVMFALVVSCAIAQERLVVETGHIGSVNNLAVDTKDSLLFSAGADGTVRSWDLSTHELASVLQVGSLPVRLLAVNPVRSEIAVFETDNISVFRLEVWNWQTGTMLFSRDLSETPLLLQYSPTGDFLVYAQTQWKSLTFLDSSTGQPLPYFDSGFGIVSSLIISDSGKSMMTYSPSGQLNYWTIDTGALRQSYTTLPNLSDISYFGNNRYMAARYNDNLVMIDLVGGQTVASANVPGIQMTAVDPSSSGIAVYSTTGASSSLGLYTYSGTLFSQGGALDAPNGNATDLLFADGTLYASLDNGMIFSDQPYYPPETFGANNLLGVNDFAVSNGRLLVSSPSSLISFTSSLFAPGDPSPGSQGVSSSVVPNPYQGATGLNALQDGSVVLWNLDGPSGSYRTYDSSGNMSDPIGSFPTPLVELTEANGRYLTLDEGGTVSLVDPVTGTSLFSYSAFGMDTAAYVDSNHIIAGRSATGTINTPLLQINSTTGETVPISDPAIVVYDVAYDAANNRVFSLGIQTTGSGSATTVLESHSVASPGSATTWLTYNGEDHGAGLTIDPATGTVYTSIGFSGVQALSSPGEPAVQFDRTDHVPRKLVVSGNWLYALNTDSTMTIWNKNTGKLLLNLYIFKDDSWAAVLASGQYYSSGGAEQYIKLFNNTTPANSSIDKYRFRF